MNKAELNQSLEFLNNPTGKSTQSSPLNSQ